MSSGLTSFEANSLVLACTIIVLLIGLGATIWIRRRQIHPPLKSRTYLIRRYSNNIELEHPRLPDARPEEQEQYIDLAHVSMGTKCHQNLSSRNYRANPGTFRKSI